MVDLAEVRVWGQTVGAVTLDESSPYARFAYTPEFAATGIELSPLRMPARPREPYEFRSLNTASFDGLPGLLADSLPDRFGRELLSSWAQSQGRSEPNAIEKLCYIGERGMGALEFRPAIGPKTGRSHIIEVSDLADLAAKVLSDREGFVASLAENETQAMRDLLTIGTSAGGARAKAVIGFQPSTGKVRSGQVGLPDGFEHWLLKFDGVKGDELRSPEGFGAIEYAYSLMAKDAGIAMPATHLLHEGERRHFMALRFDRTADGEKLHMQTLAAMLHLDYKQPRAHSYYQAFYVIDQLDLGMEAKEEMYRRMVFNVIARNQDDHVKNTSFLMDTTGQWSLSPGYDITYAYEPGNQWVNHHQMAVNGKYDDFVSADLTAAARAAALASGRARDIISQVQDSVERWAEFAEEAEVPSARATTLRSTFRLGQRWIQRPRAEGTAQTS